VQILYVQPYHHRVVRKATRRDLAEMLAELTRQTVAAEQPVLAAHGLSMWGYVVLSALDRSPIRTQSALAEAIGADKTRIIDVLDDLQARGLIRREPDPDDRRARLLTLTAKGRRLRDQVRRAIRREENRVLAALPAEERSVFLQALQRLHGAARKDR
jgi:DNA-binding MarR family transcriptional regulator